MHDREQRLAWIESLMASRASKLERRSLAVVPVGCALTEDDGDGDGVRLIGIPFEQVLEVVAGSALKQIALLPPRFCGVVAQGSELYPVVDTGGDPAQPELILLVNDREWTYGLLFRGAPHAMDADVERKEADVALPWPLKSKACANGPRGPVALLDVPATTNALLAG